MSAPFPHVPSSVGAAQALGGVASNSSTELVEQPVFPREELPSAGDWLPADIAAIRRLLEQIYAAQLAATTARRTYVDVPAMLVPGVDFMHLLDARPYGYAQVAMSATTASNIELVREGVVFAVVLTPGRFITIQQPQGTTIRLKASDPQPIQATFRYSDSVFGDVKP